MEDRAWAVLGRSPEPAAMAVNDGTADGEPHAHAGCLRYERIGLDLKLLLPKPLQRVDLLNALALAGFPCS